MLEDNDRATASAHHAKSRPHGLVHFGIMLGALCLAATTVASDQQVSYPGTDWQIAPQGLEPKVQRRVDEYVRALDTTALMVVQHGRVAYQYGDVKVLSYLASSRKSVLSMLYGPYVANGTIRLDRTVKDLGISDVGGLLPVEERATDRRVNRVK